MSSSFDLLIDRKGSNSVKWDQTKAVFGHENLLPMWVADMDFQPPKEVIDAINTRLEHGIFGYHAGGESLQEAIVEWIQRRFQWSIKKSSILYSPGVVPSIATIIQALTKKGDKILVQPPVYPLFYTMVEENERELVYAPLQKKEEGHYEINFDEFETKLKEGVSLFILCHPHNPIGRVWREEELQKMGDLCVKYNVPVISDEIHADLTFKPFKHIPLASLSDEISEMTITCMAPSKTFNLAGLQASFITTTNKSYKKRIDAIHRQRGQHGLNIFGAIGMEAAYRYGEPWLEELLTYLQKNVDTVRTFLQDNLPELTFVDPEATYLLWIDCSKTNLTDEELRKALLEKGEIGVDPGTKFNPEGEGFIRLNIACPHETLMDGLNRIKRALTNE